MTFSINVKELPETCLKDPYYKSKYCYPAYVYNLKNTWFLGFTAYKNPQNIVHEIDSFYIQNKYSKLIISKSLQDYCEINIDKGGGGFILYCRDLKGESNTLLIKCEPSKVLIVENNKGYSSTSVDYDELTPLIELGFYQSVPLICPATLLGESHVHIAHNEL